MTVEDLLKPRYKVIADFPMSICKVGEILEPQGKYFPVIEGGYWNIEIYKYPHLFKKLEWWEEREESDMPEYVKVIAEVPYWRIRKDTIHPLRRIYNYKGNWVVDLKNKENTSFKWIKISFVQPATKEEFENQPQ